MNEIIAHLIDVFDEKRCSLLHFPIILGDFENVLQFTHFYQFCSNFIGKDEVFHGLLYLYNRIFECPENIRNDGFPDVPCSTKLYSTTYLLKKQENVQTYLHLPPLLQSQQRDLLSLRKCWQILKRPSE